MGNGSLRRRLQVETLLLLLFFPFFLCVVVSLWPGGNYSLIVRALWGVLKKKTFAILATKTQK